MNEDRLATQMSRMAKDQRLIITAIVKRKRPGQAGPFNPQYENWRLGADAHRLPMAPSELIDDQTALHITAAIAVALVCIRRIALAMSQAVTQASDSQPSRNTRTDSKSSSTAIETSTAIKASSAIEASTAIKSAADAATAADPPAYRPRFCSCRQKRPCERECRNGSYAKFMYQVHTLSFSFDSKAIAFEQLRSEGRAPEAEVCRALQTRDFLVPVTAKATRESGRRKKRPRWNRGRKLETCVRFTDRRIHIGRSRDLRSTGRGLPSAARVCAWKPASSASAYSAVNAADGDARRSANGACHQRRPGTQGRQAQQSQPSRGGFSCWFPLGMGLANGRDAPTLHEQSVMPRWHLRIRFGDVASCVPLIAPERASGGDTEHNPMRNRIGGIEDQSRCRADRTGASFPLGAQQAA